MQPREWEIDRGSTHIKMGPCLYGSAAAALGYIISLVHPTRACPIFVPGPGVGPVFRIVVHRRRMSYVYGIVVERVDESGAIVSARDGRDTRSSAGSIL